MPLPPRPPSSPLILWGRLGAQPQRDVGGLHRLPHHPHQVVVQRLQVRLVAQLLAESFEGLRRIVLAAVEAAVYEGLDTMAEGVKQGRDNEGGGHDRKGGLLTREQDEDTLQHHDAAEVEGNQHNRQGAVDEGSVYDHIDVVEPMTQDGDAYGDGDAGESQEGGDLTGLFGDACEEDRVDDSGGREERSGACEPLELLTLRATGATETEYEGDARE